MKQWRQQSVSWILVCAFMLQAVCGHAAFRKSAPNIRVAMMPVHDGQNDIASTQLAESLHTALAQRSSLRLLRPRRADAIVRYQAESQQEPAAVRSARQALKQAQKDFLQFRNSAATRSLDAVDQQIGSDAALMAEFGQLLVQAELVRAQLAHSQGATGRMRKALQRVVALAPQHEFSTAEMAPSVRRVLRAEQKRAAKQASGSLQVASKPAAVDVLLNGRYVGKTPLQLSGLPEGAYHVAVRANRYATAHQVMQVAADQEAQWKPRLQYQRKAARPKSNVLSADRKAHMAAALQVAAVTRADTVVTINVDEDVNRRGQIEARVIDASTKKVAKVLTLPLTRNRSRLQTDLADFSEKIVRAVQPKALLSAAQQREIARTTPGAAMPAAPKRRVSPWVWVAAGVLAVGGIAAGVALSSGGGSTAETGAVVLRFE